MPEESAASADAVRILLVDDDARILRALQALLRAHTTIPGAGNNAAALATQHDVDVVICNQGNAAATGIEILTELKQAHPRAARILLDDYPSIDAVRAAINKAEVFRFVEKPWHNTRLRTFLDEAVEAARAPLPGSATMTQFDHEQMCARVAVLIMEDDADVQHRLREMLQPGYKVHFANSIERAVQVMEQHETGVVICDTRIGRSDFTLPLKTLKQTHPHISVVVVSEFIDAETAIGLINEAQIYRLLPRRGSADAFRAVVDAALTRYWRFKQNPPSTRRGMATPLAENENSSPALSSALFNRIRTLPWHVGGTDPH